MSSENISLCQPLSSPMQRHLNCKETLPLVFWFSFVYFKSHLPHRWMFLNISPFRGEPTTEFCDPTDRCRCRIMKMVVFKEGNALLQMVNYFQVAWEALPLKVWSLAPNARGLAKTYYGERRSQTSVLLGAESTMSPPSFHLFLSTFFAVHKLLVLYSRILSLFDVIFKIYLLLMLLLYTIALI